MQSSFCAPLYFDYSRNMELLIPTRLATLGHPQRLALFRLLMRRYPDHVPAGELAAALGLKPSTLSAYLAALMQAGLVVQERAGTSLRYAVDMATTQATMDYLFTDCCRGRPEFCAPGSDARRPGAGEIPGQKFNALFICTGNSARSLFAEALLRDRGGDRFTVFSAGTRPASAPNPDAIALLRAKGHDVSALRPKSVGEFAGPDAPQMDFVFTVCDQAANEECPAWDGQPITAHWGLPDPVKATGTQAEKGLAFQRTYGALARRVDVFAALPVETLDRIGLQAAVDDIARFGKDR
jgi:ArsR family transcriptional regulator, arsenate/arsenite/antimonite-responsive transcriptional repressor / arsenate reductase (thioredoxin)